MKLRRRRKGRTLRVCLSESPLLRWGPAHLGMAEHLPGHGKQPVNSLFCSACVNLLFFLLNCFYHEFCRFFSSSNSFTPPTTGERVNSCVGLNCWLGVNDQSTSLTIRYCSWCLKSTQLQGAKSKLQWKKEK